MDAATTIARALRSFTAASADPSLFAHNGDFGMHEGRVLAEWTAHEIAEFGRRSAVFGLDGGLSVEIERAGKDGSVCFAVLDGKGRFVYQDTWVLDGDGRVHGNRRAFEIVTKLRFEEGTEASRGLAIRSHGTRIRSVVPLGAAVTSFSTNDGMGYDEDGFTSVAMTIEDDDLLGRFMSFRISDHRGLAASEEVWLRGRDERRFEGPLYPVLGRRSVLVPASASRPWSLSVALADGSRSVVSHPDPGSHLFPADVEAAVLTDAMDNDWIVRREGGND